MDDCMKWAYAGFEGGEDNKNNKSRKMEVELELGSIYQINHSNLTPRTPVPLRSIRLVMVSEKTEWNVSVRYPSIESLKRYFNNKFNEIYPEMDQKFVMDRKLAERVLFRRVPSEEFLVKKDMEEFWLVMSSSGGSEKSGNLVSKKDGFCLSELKSSVAVPGWGVRRQVKFIGRHREPNSSPSSCSIVKEGDNEMVLGDEEIELEDEKEENEKEEENGEGEEEEKVEEGEEEVVKKEVVETYQRPKRKCCDVNLKASIKKAKKVKLEKNKKEKTESKKEPNNLPKAKKGPKSKCMEIVLAKSPMSSRWSEDRYKQAQTHLLEVMKANGATCEKPILRPDLRADARKKIGDTGLLDHLLKHVAGMTAPGGKERFRRRHNTDGQMEYWLESAELADLRREVGVEDPYWTPPPGWKVGDNPTQDPICAQDIKELKAETAKLKRNMKDMISRKQMEKELAKVRREMEKLISRSQRKESQAIVVSNPTKKQLAATSTPSKSDSSYVNMEKYYKEQLTILSDHFTRIEGEMVNLKSQLEENKSSEQALIALTESLTEKEKTKTLTSGKTVLVHPRMEKGTQTQVDPTATPSVRDTAAEKAAKIERLKSGFRICKPQGTFLWPNSSGTNNVVVQVEDMAVVPTPPSVSSATAFVPRTLPPPSPVRPRPEKRAITVTVSSVGNSNFSSCTATTTGSSNKTTTWINLNDAPGVNVEGGIPSSRQQLVSASADVVSPVCVKGEPVKSPTESSKKEAATWLALAAPADFVEEPTLG